MRKAVFTAALIFALASALLGGTKRDFRPGKLVSITTDETLVHGTSYRRAIFTVQIGNLVIVGRGGRIRRRSGDIGQGLIVGDTVQAAVDGGDLIMLKPDGKELKTRIIKRERSQ